MSPADPISTGASERTFASAAYIAEVSREGQLAQLQEIDGLDQKASSLIGFAGVILGLLFTSSFASQHWSLVSRSAPGFLPRPSCPAATRSFHAITSSTPTRLRSTSVRREIEFNATRVKLKSRAILTGTGMIVGAVS